MFCSLAVTCCDPWLDRLHLRPDPSSHWPAGSSPAGRARGSVRSRVRAPAEAEGRRARRARRAQRWTAAAPAVETIPTGPDAGCDLRRRAWGLPLDPCGNGTLNPPAETCDDGNQSGRRRLLARLPDRDRLDLPDAWPGLHVHRGLRRRHHRRRGDLRRPQHDARRRLRRQLPARARMDLPPGRRAVSFRVAATA